MRLLLCDDHALFRDGLELVLGELDTGVELEGVGDAEALLAAVSERGEELDLVLLDIRLPGMNGFEALVRLRSEHPDLPIVVVSASERPEDVRRALAGGAAGFIPKSTRGPVLLNALRLVLSGGVYVPAVMLDAPHAVSPKPLSPRQLEVLRLLARGLTNQEISSVLGISPSTVKSHVVHIYETLDVSNRTEAAMRLRELGLDEE